jgi:hypothetical protein
LPRFARLARYAGSQRVRNSRLGLHNGLDVPHGQVVAEAGYQRPINEVLAEHTRKDVA